MGCVVRGGGGGLCVCVLVCVCVCICGALLIANVIKRYYEEIFRKWLGILFHLPDYVSAQKCSLSVCVCVCVCVCGWVGCVGCVGMCVWWGGSWVVAVCVC